MYESCIRYVYSIVARYVSNESDYQDVIQEIFARIFLSINSFDENKGEFKYWLRRLCINQCIKHYHKTGMAIKSVSIDKEARLQPSTGADANSLSSDDILTCLSGMPSGYKEVFMLVVIDEYTHKEVGEMLNISAETSRSQLHRAKKWIRDNLSRNNLNTLVSGL